MRMLGSVLAFVLLVLSAHWAIFSLYPGIADVRASAASSSPVAAHR